MKRINGMPRWRAYQNWYSYADPICKAEGEIIQAVTKAIMIATIVALVAMICGVLFFSFFTPQEVRPGFTRFDTMQTFFKANGSPVPAVMANAVQQTKRPTLMAALAVQESNGTPWAVGDNGKSKGAFQVQPRHWGKVPVDAVAQALQAEKILDELLARRGRLRPAIIAYNGAGPAARAYERRVSRLERSLR